MKALLTGSSGFIGRHLHTELIERGYDVTSCDIIDGRDALDLFRTDRTSYDLAVHCAAIVGGRASIDGTPLAVATNMALDSWYFRWLVNSGTKRAVYYSSSAAYPVDLQLTGSTHRLSEDDINLDSPRVPDATYGLAKLAGEQLARYAAAEGCRIHVLRPMSGYGEDQALDYPFPALIHRAHRHEDPFHVWGTGEQVRDWIHISDVVAGTMAVVDCDVTVPVNLCTGRGTSFLDLAAMITKSYGYQPQIVPLPDKPAGVNYRVGDPTFMQSLYTPRVSLEDGIEKALAKF